MSGRDAAVLVPKICEDDQGYGLNKIPNISGIIVFCQNEIVHRQWSQKYPIVSLVSSKPSTVFEEAERLLQSTTGLGMNEIVNQKMEEKKTDVRE